MHIEHWTLNRKMQLPDHCFGRRFVVGLSFIVLTEDIYYDICEIPLPDLAVIWELSIWVPNSISGDSILRLALGDKLPGTQAEFEALEPVFQSIGSPTVGPRRIWMQDIGDYALRTLRMPIEPQGRRLVGELEAGGAAEGQVLVNMVVSGIPREIPDWLVSGIPKNLL